MKKKEIEARKKMVVVRMNNTEFELFKKYCKQSTQRNYSSYLREVALKKPVVVKHGNQSADDFLKEMLGLKKELNSIGNNFNQAVHKLHILEKIPEFRSWVNHYDGLKNDLLKKIDEIKLRMQQTYEVWSQK